LARLFPAVKIPFQTRRGSCGCARSNRRWKHGRERSRLSNSSSVAKPIDYVLRRFGRFVRFIDDGRISRTNNAVPSAR
jgi:hypothetical protein